MPRPHAVADGRAPLRQKSWSALSAGQQKRLPRSIFRWMPLAAVVDMALVEIHLVPCWRIMGPDSPEIDRIPGGRRMGHGQPAVTESIQATFIPSNGSSAVGGVGFLCSTRRLNCNIKRRPVSPAICA